mgnify:CR=1 FL=1
MRHAMNTREETWVKACSKFMENDEWYLFTEDYAVGMIMKFSGGSLHPAFVKDRVAMLFDDGLK